MSELVARSNAAYPLLPSKSVAIVSLFCLLGLAITVAIAPLFPAGDLGWALSHIE
jgi:hypothetical protein